jgi:hypothetical protein
MSAGLGFLSVDVTNNKPSTPDFGLTFSADVTSDYSISNPQISGSLGADHKIVDLNLGLASSLAVKGLPAFKTDMVLQWGLPGVSPSDALGASWGVPVLQFNNVEMNIGSVLGDLVSPLADKAVALMQPLQPIFDLLQKRIPGISDLSQDMGGPEVNLLEMNNVLSQLPNYPPELLNTINAVQRLQQMSETAQHLASLGDKWIKIGDFTISGPGGQSLLDDATKALSNLGLGNWSDLVGASGNALTSFSALETAIQQALPDPIGNAVGDQINALFNALTADSSDDGLTFSCPIANDPSGAALGFLLGQDTDLVDVKAHFHEGIDRVIDVSPIPGIIVGLHGTGNFDASAELGYDTRGIRDAIAPIYNGGSPDTSKLFDGLWISKDTHLSGDGSIDIVAGIGIPDVAELLPGGGFKANVLMNLSNPNNVDKLRPFLGDLGPGLFNVSGELDATASVTLKVGFDLFGTWIGIDHKWEYLSGTIFKFDTSTLPVPNEFKPPPPVIPVLAQYDPTQRTLTLAAGDFASLRNDADLASIIDENFTVRRTADGALTVSAFGFTQRFDQPIDKVIALMGDGNDTLTVYEQASPTEYLIDGGAGDDTIDVNGNVNVDIFGGPGNDTIDGGGGWDHINVNGGPDFNTITLGHGHLENVNPNASITLNPFSGIGLGSLIIDNSNDTYGSSYSFVPSPENIRHTVTIVSKGPGHVTHVIDLGETELTLRAGPANDDFYGWFGPSTRVYAGGGDNTWDVAGDGPAGPQEGFLPDLHYSMLFYGGDGHNKVILDDSQQPADGIKLRVAYDGSSWASWGNNYQTSVLLQGVQETTVKGGFVETSAWSGDTLNITASLAAQFDVDSYEFISKAHVTSTPTIIFTATSADTQSAASVDQFGPYLGNPNGYIQQPDGTLVVATLTAPAGPAVNKMRIDYDNTATNVRFFVPTFYIEPSVLYSTRTWNFNYTGLAFTPTEVNTIRIAPPDPNTPGFVTQDYQYHISADSITIGPMTLQASLYQQLSLTGGQGNDTITVDSIAPGVSATLDGGPGNNTLIVDNRRSTDDTLWEIHPDFVFWEDQVLFNHDSVATQNIQNAEYLGGSGKNTFTVTGVFSQPIDVRGGSGDNTFQIGEPVFPAEFHATAYFEGGAGNDSFTWYTANNVFTDGTTSTTYPVVITGGAGYNTLTVDDTTRGSANIVRGSVSGTVTYALFDNEIRASQDGAGVGADFSFMGMGALTLNLSANSNIVRVYGVSSDIAPQSQVSIDGGAGDDTFYIYPLGAEDTPSLNGNLGINGGGGNDAVILNNSTSTLGLTYTFDNPFGYQTTDVHGFGDFGVGVAGDVELLRILAGSGDDVFSVESYLSPTTALSVETGAGNNVVDLLPTSKNAQTAFTSAASLAFEGGSGNNSFNFHNDNAPYGYAYTRDGDLLTVTDTQFGYSFNFNVVGFQTWTIFGSAQNEGFNVDALPSGQTLILDGGAALDDVRITQARHNSQEIQGQIVINAGEGGATLTVDDTANTTGAIVHVDPNNDGTIGAWPGDTLFGPGGSLQYQNLADGIDGVGLTLELGNGPDTIYARPQANVTLWVLGNYPTTSPGDRLYLALASAQNPSVQDFGNGNGDVTSSNLKPVFWSGIEQVSSDYVEVGSLLVVNTLDSGPGTLRQAILDANATANVGGPDVIRFAIPGAGPHTIQPLSPLPAILDPVVLDATTQPGYNGMPVIELDGSLVTGVDSDGLDIFSGGTTVRGFAINRFTGAANAGIWIAGPGGNVIQDNYIGTNLTGDGAFTSYIQYGVVIFGSSGNIIGTNEDGINDAAEGNVISGQQTGGILFETDGQGNQASDNLIAGNRIGTSADGNTALGNGRMGIFILGSGTGNGINGNLISGNPESGIYIGSDNIVVTGNQLGTNADGTAALPNGYGISIQFGNNNRIGGTGPLDGNVIAYSRFSGVLVENGGTGNAILGNSVYGNGALGINLLASGDPYSGVTPNDPGDADSGSNDLQNFPQIGTALVTGTDTFISGTLHSTPNIGFRIEFFASSDADPTGYGQGRSYLGYVNVLTNSAGLANFVAQLPLVPLGDVISATATDESGNTSEFSLSVPVVSQSSLTNVQPLSVPSTGSPFLISSPAGSQITATVTATPAVPPPGALVFPFGLVSFTITGLTPGGSADVTLAGLDPSQIRDYYKYGPTPANHTAHWYDFLFNHRTDSDNPTSTGMEIRNGTIVLHLVDGGRGDDDLSPNGTITDLGGPVLNHAPVPGADALTTREDLAITVSTAALKKNDTDADNDVLTVTAVANATHGTVSLVNGAVKFTPTPNFNGTAGFDYTVSDGLLTGIGHVTLLVKEVNDAPVANPDTKTRLFGEMRV